MVIRIGGEKTAEGVKDSSSAIRAGVVGRRLR